MDAVGNGDNDHSSVDGGPPLAPPAVCTDPTVNTEPGIIVGCDPWMGQAVGQAGQIKVWVRDENSAFIAPGEVVDNTTGAIANPGDRTATAADGLLYEPALYIAPQSPTNGGTPYFPQWIKGPYNNNPPHQVVTSDGGSPVDPAPESSFKCLPPFLVGGRESPYQTEFVWDVSALGLAPGMYTAVFSLHDGDLDRAIGCVTIGITR